MARPPKITNEEILAAARQIFLEQGIGASTLAIAEKAGISEASIFKRFVTKQALFLAAMGVAETPKWVKTLSSRQPTAALQSELTEICEQMLAFYQEVLPRVMMMMTQNNMPHPPLVTPPPPVRDSQLLAGFLARAIDQGHLRPCDAPTIAHMMVGAIVNYVIAGNIANQRPNPLPLPLPQPIEPAPFIHNLIEVLWSGISPDP